MTVSDGKNKLKPPRIDDTYMHYYIESFKYRTDNAEEKKTNAS